MRTSTKIRSELASASRYTPDDSVTIECLRTEHRAARAAEYLRRVVGAAPPLTPAQIAELQAILAPADLNASGLFDAREA